MTGRITLIINGEPVQVEGGVTVGSILHERQSALRASPLSHAPRGLYCGMGVCFECAVTIDGQSMRACITTARDGMHVEALP